ncbi:Uncharacterised protein [Vibrio cholerae]|nr:Uncharacterised protein [Vibrio cholerae]
MPALILAAKSSKKRWITCTTTIKKFILHSTPSPILMVSSAGLTR